MSANDYEVRVDVSIRSYQGGGNLQLSETVQIPDCTFDDMAGILHGFHELALSIKAARERISA